MLGPGPGSGPTISVVMPTYRRPAQVGASIESLLRGSFGDFELLVRDDGPGDDGTEQAVAALASRDSRVSYKRNPQRLGMPGNLNAGILEARGRYIAVCHDHDLYAADFLKTMLDTLERNPGAMFVH